MDGVKTSGTQQRTLKLLQRKQGTYRHTRPPPSYVARISTWHRRSFLSPEQHLLHLRQPHGGSPHTFCTGPGRRRLSLLRKTLDIFESARPDRTVIAIRRATKVRYFRETRTLLCQCLRVRESVPKVGPRAPSKVESHKNGPTSTPARPHHDDGPPLGHIFQTRPASAETTKGPPSLGSSRGLRRGLSSIYLCTRIPEDVQELSSMAHQQPRLRPSEENYVGATRRTNEGAQIGAQSDLRLTCGAQQYHAAPVSGFSEPMIPNSTMSPPYFALERAAQVEGGFSAAGSPSYLGFNEGIPTPIDHPPSSSDDPDRHHTENNNRHLHHHHQPPYDPRFFDVGTSFLPTTVPQPRAGPSTFPDALVPWQNPPHNHLPFQSGSTHVSMMTSEPPLDLAPMPPAPGMSSFEPMITTLEGPLGARTPRAPGMAPTAQSPNFPSSGNNNSDNYLSTNTGRLEIRFEQVSEPQAGARTTTTRKKSSTKNSSRDRPAPTKRAKPEAGATRKIPTTKNDNSLTNDIEDDNSYYYYNNNNNNNNAIDASTAPGDESSPEKPGQYLDSPESPAQDVYGDLNEQGGIVQESYYDHYATVQEFLASRPPPVGTQRERNRTAATKCRAKTKVVEARLEATERTMWEENTQLAAQVVGLREEVLALKTELLRHGYCDCELIQRYIRSEAMKIGGATTTPASMVPGSHSPGQQQYPPVLQHLQAVMAEEESLGQGPGRPEVFRNDSNASSSMTPVTMMTTTPSAGSGHYTQQKHAQN